jgi:hypothetical protein
MSFPLFYDVFSNIKLRQLPIYKKSSIQSKTSLKTLPNLASNYLLEMV